jgi:hypothetical protein
MTNVDKLATAILNGNIKAVRQIVGSDPSLASQKTRSNQFPIELAKEKGLKRIEAILLLTSADNKQLYQDNQLSDFIGHLISELSEDIYSAGWIDGIEKELWYRSEGIDINPNENTSRIDKNEIDELRALANKLGYWAYWDDNCESNNIRPIKIEDWKRRIGE